MEWMKIYQTNCGATALITLGKEPQLLEVLTEIVENFSMFRTLSVEIILFDFADVDIIITSSIAKLHQLRISCKDNHKLILGNVSPKTKSIFDVTGSIPYFDFMDKILFESKDGCIN